MKGKQEPVAWSIQKGPLYLNPPGKEDQTVGRHLPLLSKGIRAGVIVTTLVSGAYAIHKILTEPENLVRVGKTIFAYFLPEDFLPTSTGEEVEHFDVLGELKKAAGVLLDFFF